EPPQLRAPALPPVALPAGEQLQLRAGAAAFDLLVELLRLAGVLAGGPSLQRGRLAGPHEAGPAPHGPPARLPPPPPPLQPPAPISSSTHAGVFLWGTPQPFTPSRPSQ